MISLTSQYEENFDLQNRSAIAVASFIEFCVDHNISQPPDKIVKNLCTFLCQDVEHTPTFAYSRHVTDGILSFQTPDSSAVSKSSKELLSEKDKLESEKSQDAKRAAVARRGASQAFQQLSAKFGPQLLEVIPNMWISMASGLLSACHTGKSWQTACIQF